MPDAAKRRFYPERHFATALQDAERTGAADTDELRRLRDFIRDGAVDQKREDARVLLDTRRIGSPEVRPLSPRASHSSVTPGAAKVALHRARQRLRRALRLQTLAHRCAGSCDELRALYDAGELSAAAAHVEACPTCARVDAGVEVEGFAVVTAG